MKAIVTFWFIRSHKFFFLLSSGVVLLLLFLLSFALNVVSLTLRKANKKSWLVNRIEKADYSCVVVVVSLFSWECWSLKHDAIKNITWCRVLDAVVF
jgi:hypothetical protein